MPIVNIVGLSTRKQAKDYKSVDSQHKTGTKGASAAANVKPPVYPSK